MTDLLVVRHGRVTRRSLQTLSRQAEGWRAEIVGAAPWVGQRHWNMESIYEYGARAGFWRLWRGFVARDIKPRKG